MFVVILYSRRKTDETTSQQLSVSVQPVFLFYVNKTLCCVVLCCTPSLVSACESVLILTINECQNNSIISCVGLIQLLSIG